MEKFPRLRTSLQHYVKACKYFENGELFTPLELAKKICHGEAKRVIEKAKSIYAHLRQLACYGLVNWYENSTFAIDLRPSDPVEIWKEKLGIRGIELRSEIKRAASKNLLIIYVGKKKTNVYYQHVKRAFNSGKYSGIRIMSRGHFNIKAKVLSRILLKERNPSEFMLEEEKFIPIRYDGRTVIQQEIILKQ